jgi:hypothetical protein
VRNVFFCAKKDFANEKTINTFARTKKAFLSILKKLNFPTGKILAAFPQNIKR